MKKVLFQKSIFNKSYFFLMLGFSGGTSGKEFTCQCRRHKRWGFNSWEDRLERKWQPTPVFLSGELHGQRSLEGYSPRGCKELDMTKVT